MQIDQYLEKYQPVIYKTFVNALKEDKLSHAYLLSGSIGMPLKETALYLAKSIICDNPHPSAAFMLVADDAERDYAVLEKTKDLPKKWSDLGFNVISMKNDFKTIYGENVIKKPVVA